MSRVTIKNAFVETQLIGFVSPPFQRPGHIFEPPLPPQEVATQRVSPKLESRGQNPGQKAFHVQPEGFDAAAVQRQRIPGQVFWCSDKLGEACHYFPSVLMLYEIAALAVAPGSPFGGGGSVSVHLSKKHFLNATLDISSIRK